MMTTRERLTAPLTLFASSAGSNSNDGLSAAQPLASASFAANVLRDGYDLAGLKAKIEIARGSVFSEGLYVQGPFVGAVDHGSVEIAPSAGTGGLPIFSGMTQAATIDGAAVTIGPLDLRPSVDPAVAGCHCFVVANRGVLAVTGRGILRAPAWNTHDFTVSGHSRLVFTADAAFDLYGSARRFLHCRVDGFGIASGSYALWPQEGAVTYDWFCDADYMGLISTVVANAASIAGLIKSGSPKSEHGRAVVVTDTSFVAAPVTP